MSLTIIDNIKTCNSLKESFTGFDIYQMEMDFLKSQGKENSAEYLDSKQKYDVQKAKYDSLGCVVDKKSMDCITLSQQIESMINLISTESKLALYDKRKLSEIEGYKKILAQYKLDFETKGCLLVLNKIAQSETNKTISQFTNLDEARIDEETKYQTQQRVFFGGLVLVVGLVIITMFNGNKK